MSALRFTVDDLMLAPLDNLAVLSEAVEEALVAAGYRASRPRAIGLPKKIISERTVRCALTSLLIYMQALNLDPTDFLLFDEETKKLVPCKSKADALATIRSVMAKRRVAAKKLRLRIFDKA